MATCRKRSMRSCSNIRPSCAEQLNSRKPWQRRQQLHQRRRCLLPLLRLHRATTMIATLMIATLAAAAMVVPMIAVAVVSVTLAPATLLPPLLRCCLPRLPILAVPLRGCSRSRACRWVARTACRRRCLAIRAPMACRCRCPMECNRRCRWADTECIRCRCRCSNHNTCSSSNTTLHREEPTDIRCRCNSSSNSLRLIMTAIDLDRDPESAISTADEAGGHRLRQLIVRPSFH